MRLCYESCYVAATDSSGAWAFASVPTADYALQAVVLGDSSYATPHAIVMLGSGENRRLTDEYVIHPFATRTELPEGSAVEVEGDGIVIEAQQEALQEGSYTPDWASYYVATVEVDPADAGLPWDGLTGTPVAMWYLGNFDMTVDPAFSFTTTRDYGLAPGTTVEIWSTSNEDHGWIYGGNATVTTDGRIAADPGSGIQRLTTLVLTIP